MSEAPADWAGSGPRASLEPGSGDVREVAPPEGTLGTDADADAAADQVDEANDEADAAPGPSPLGLEPDVTGNADVDTVLQRLSDADELPTQDHVDVYEDVHGSLRDVLAALDEQHQRSPAPQPPTAAWNRS